MWTDGLHLKEVADIWCVDWNHVHHMFVWVSVPTPPHTHTGFLPAHTPDPGGGEEPLCDNPPFCKWKPSFSLVLNVAVNASRRFILLWSMYRTCLLFEHVLTQAHVQACVELASWQRSRPARISQHKCEKVTDPHGWPRTSHTKLNLYPTPGAGAAAESTDTDSIRSIQ